jgi:hypothetical protein
MKRKQPRRLREDRDYRRLWHCVSVAIRAADDLGQRRAYRAAASTTRSTDFRMVTSWCRHPECLKRSMFICRSREWICQSHASRSAGE